MVGTAMKNTFTSMQQEFPNAVLHGFVDEVISVRQQICCTAEVNKIKGWEDPLNAWMMDSFAVLTSDLDRMLQLSSEAVPMSAMVAHTSIGHDLSGNAKNLRQPTQRAVRNTGLRLIVSWLDQLATICTHFDSRWVQCGINQMEHDQAETFLTRCYGICQSHGGTANMRPVISGVLPEDLDNGFNYSGQYDTDMGSLDVGSMVLAEGFRTNGNGSNVPNSVSGVSGVGRVPGSGAPPRR